MDMVENTIEKVIYVLSEVIIDIALLCAFSYYAVFGFLGDQVFQKEADRLFEKMKAKFTA